MSIIYCKTMPDFRNYYRPRHIDEAIKVLSENGEGGVILAGGTDVLIWMRQRSLEPEYVLDITGIENLDYIDLVDGGETRIGALVTIGDIRRSKELSKRYPLLYEVANKMGNVQVSNLATATGNICRASPSADMGCALLALDSKVEIVGPDSTRDVALSDFYIGSGETVLKNNEIVKEIIIPALKSSTGTVFLRATRSDADLATVNVAVTMTMEGDECIDARVVLGSVSTTLLRVKEAEKVLRDHAIDEALAEKSGRIASDATNPRDEGGVRASIDYKKHMAQVLTKEATMIACKRAKQEQD